MLTILSTLNVQNCTGYRCRDRAGATAYAPAASCVFFAHDKNIVKYQLLGVLAYPLLTMLSTLYVQNCRRGHFRCQNFPKYHVNNRIISHCRQDACFLRREILFFQINDFAWHGRPCTQSYQQNMCRSRHNFCWIYRRAVVKICNIFGLDN